MEIIIIIGSMFILPLIFMYFIWLICQRIKEEELREVNDKWAEIQSEIDEIKKILK